MAWFHVASFPGPSTRRGGDRVDLGMVFRVETFHDRHPIRLSRSRHASLRRMCAWPAGVLIRNEILSPTVMIGRGTCNARWPKSWARYQSWGCKELRMLYVAQTPSTKGRKALIGSSEANMLSPCTTHNSPPQPHTRPRRLGIAGHPTGVVRQPCAARLRPSAWRPVWIAAPCVTPALTIQTWL
jgi:hypothetical protein